jgi:hypothetical protein
MENQSHLAREGLQGHKAYATPSPVTTDGNMQCLQVVALFLRMAACASALETLSQVLRTVLTSDV